MPPEDFCDKYRDKCSNILKLLQNGLPPKFLEKRGIKPGSEREKKLKNNLAYVYARCCARHMGWIGPPRKPEDKPLGLPTPLAVGLTYSGALEAGGAGLGATLDALWAWLQRHGIAAFLRRFGPIALFYVSYVFISRFIRTVRCRLIAEADFDIPQIKLCIYLCDDGTGRFYTGPLGQLICNDTIGAPV